MTNLNLPVQAILEALCERMAQRTAQILKDEWSPQPPHSPQPNVEAEIPINTEEVCRLLRISRKTLGDWRAEGKIPFFRKGRKVYFFRSAVLASLEEPKRIGGKGNRRYTRGVGLSGRSAA